MANYDIDVVANNHAHIRQNFPDTNRRMDYAEIGLTQLVPAVRWNLLVGFTLPQSLQGRRITGFEIRLYQTGSMSLDPDYNWIWDYNIHARRNLAAWDASIATWNNAPAASSVEARVIGQSSSPGWVVVPSSSLTGGSVFDWFLQQYGVLISCDNMSPGTYGYIAFATEMAASGQRPILRINTTDATPVVEQHSPSNGAYCNPYYAALFSWQTVGAEDDVYGSMQTSGSLFRYRKIGDTPYAEITLADNARSYLLPADTLDAEAEYEWQIIEITKDGVQSSASAWHTITTTDAVPQPPTLLSPVQAYVEVDRPATFAWRHVIDTGSPPTGADLQYRPAGGEWTSLATVSGVAQSVVIDAEMLPSGQLQWRARTYNTDSVASDWSAPAALVGIGSPATPSITGITNSSWPTVSWQSSGQVAFQVRFLKGPSLVFDTGEMAGTNKSYQLTQFLSNGDYIAEVRVKNTSALWSDWASLIFAVDIPQPEPPVITVTTVENGAHIAIATDGTEAKAYLLRDGIPIADVTGLAGYTDYAALGASTYVVRVIDLNSSFADSAPTTVIVTVSCAVLAAVDDLNNYVIMNMKSSGQPAVTRDKGLLGALHYYAGRKYPVYTFSGNIDEQYSPSYYYTSLQDWRALEALIDRRQTLLYRDRLGNRYYGVVSGVSHTHENDQIAFALTMQRVDYVEGIDYAGVS